QERERRAQILIILGESAFALVAPAAVGVLPRANRLEQLLLPIMLLAAGIGEWVLAPRGHGFAEGVIVVVQARFAHADVLFERVVAAHPIDGRLDARIVLADAGVEKAFEAAVGHRAQRAQAAFGSLVDF